MTMVATVEAVEQVITVEAGRWESSRDPLGKPPIALYAGRLENSGPRL